MTRLEAIPSLPGSFLSKRASAMVTALRDLFQRTEPGTGRKLAMKDPIDGIFSFAPVNEVKALW